MSNLTLLLAAEKDNGFWLPADFNEVIWGSISFFIVVFLLVKFLKEPIAKYYAGRAEKIEEELGAAESVRTTAEQARDSVRAALADSEAEKGRILAEARASAETIRSETQDRAAADAAAVRERGRADLETARAQAQSDLSSELSRLSFGAAEKIVEASMDDATQQRLIDAYISQVGSQN